MRPLNATAIRLCERTERITNAFDAERWASSLLGQIWLHRWDQPTRPDEDYFLALGSRLISAIARTGGLGAQIALSAIDGLSYGQLGSLAGELAQDVAELNGPGPDWIATIGNVNVIETAIVRDRKNDDGSIVFLDVRRGERDGHAIAMYIDNQLGGMAKHIGLLGPLHEIRDSDPDSPHVPTDSERVDPGFAAECIEDAIEVTDFTVEPPVGDGFEHLRALALQRARSIPAIDLNQSRRSEVS